MNRKLAVILLSCVAIALFLVGCGSSEPAYSPDMIAEGETEYQKTCSPCHGQDARGVENLGRTLIGSEFVTDNTDEALLTYVNEGRAVDDPLNITGVAMPPKGGNPNLTDDQILAIIAYIRSIQE
jgi:disulfide bond formation protein DsbB